MTALKTAPDAGMAARLDPVIDRAIANAQIVGVVTLIARGGSLVYQRVAGLADREAKRAMSADAIFRYASLTKLIVSVTALSMVQNGQLSLDEPITTWLPDFRPRLADGREPAITVRQLLTHTSGLSYGFSEPDDGPYHRANVSDGMDQPGLSMDENLRRLASVPLLFEPGAKWEYSLSTDVLGKVIERASGASLQEMVERVVTGPLEMRDSAFGVRDRARLVTPYADGSPQPVRMGELHKVPFPPSAICFSPGRILDPKSYPSGGTGMAGTAQDYLRFIEALRREGAPILRAETARMLTSNSIGNLPLFLGPGWGFGLGVGVLVDPAAAQTPQKTGSWTWGGVYGNHYFVDPKNEISVVTLTNTAVAGMIGAFPQAIRDAVYGAS